MSKYVQHMYFYFKKQILQKYSYYKKINNIFIRTEFTRQWLLQKKKNRAECKINLLNICFPRAEFTNTRTSVLQRHKVSDSPGQGLFSRITLFYYLNVQILRLLSSSVLGGKCFKHRDEINRYRKLHNFARPMAQWFCWLLYKNHVITIISSPRVVLPIWTFKERISTT